MDSAVWLFQRSGRAWHHRRRGFAHWPSRTLFFVSNARSAYRGSETGWHGRAFLALLFLTSITGLILLAARQTVAMGPLLLIHLAIVLALFLSMPYGKFVHGLYRSAALVRYALERWRGEQTKQPTN